jgi:TruD family tRNA pseudouridine synthase
MLLIEVNNLSQPLASSQCASIKTYPEDWRVTEIIDQSWSSEGEHAYIYVEKRGMNTAAVAAWLARCYQVKEMNVGFSGMKDKFAVTQQWFSVHSPLDFKIDRFSFSRLERVGVSICKGAANHSA